MVADGANGREDGQGTAGWYDVIRGNARMEAVVTAVAALLVLASIVVGAAFGVWLARRVSLTPIVSLPAGRLHEAGHQGFVWSLRVFVFVIGVLVVSAPVTYLLGLLLELF